MKKLVKTRVFSIYENGDLGRIGYDSLEDAKKAAKGVPEIVGQASVEVPYEVPDQDQSETENGGK